MKYFNNLLFLACLVNAITIGFWLQASEYANLSQSAFKIVNNTGHAIQIQVKNERKKTIVEKEIKPDGIFIINEQNFPLYMTIKHAGLSPDLKEQFPDLKKMILQDRKKPSQIRFYYNQDGQLVTHSSLWQ